MTEKDDKKDASLPTFKPAYGTVAPIGPSGPSDGPTMPRKAPPLDIKGINTIPPTEVPKWAVNSVTPEPEPSPPPMTDEQWAAMVPSNGKDKDPYKAEGRKFDNDKPRWSLLPLTALTPIVKVLTHGARKYDDHNWKYVPNAKDRYFSAALRHLEAWQSGEVTDKESSLPHLAHAACCLVFLIWLEKEGKL